MNEMRFGYSYPCLYQIKGTEMGTQVRRSKKSPRGNIKREKETKEERI